MKHKLEIRESSALDGPTIEKLYVDALPSEDLLPLIGELLPLQKGVISLVAIHQQQIVGHIAFTLCNVKDDKEPVALLAPLAVTPNCQRQGVGTALVEKGFQHLEKAKICHVIVLGDPAYYGRFGFKTEVKVTPPYTLPPEWQEAWQSLKLTNRDKSLEGKLFVPEPWQHPSLWTS